MRLKTGNTEDGLFIDLEITRNKKGDVSLTGVKYIPTWVYKNASGPTYSIVPVDDPSTVEEKTGIKESRPRLRVPTTERTRSSVTERIKSARHTDFKNRQPLQKSEDIGQCRLLIFVQILS